MPKASFTQAPVEILSEQLDDLKAFTNLTQADVEKVQDILKGKTAKSALLSDGTVVTFTPQVAFDDRFTPTVQEASLALVVPIPEDLTVGPSLTLNPNTDVENFFDANKERAVRLLDLPSTSGLQRRFLGLGPDDSIDEAILDALRRSQLLGRRISNQ